MTKYEVLSTYFGYQTFRAGQEPLIDSILNGQDVLGIMPTGAGKSICYQVPALLLDGITIVVSPLISLMKDQVAALNQAGVHAAYINSSLTEGQISKALYYAANGRYKIIYASPERLETSSFLQFAMQADISMVTIDEAHCISQWGQDFRPSYLNIVEFIKRLPKRPVISAFTATATQEVKEDIGCILGLKNANVTVMGFDRKNLFFEVRTPKKKMVELISYVKEHKGESGIIYCSTRKNVDKIYETLIEEGVLATRYHAGLSNEERQKNQDDFIYDKAPVMVATNAFGMGIDKSNVRYVVHFNMPQSLENYYQEAGRAGRDGEESECILLYSPQDIMINQMLIESNQPNERYSYEDAMLIRNRDEERLNKMIQYCLTTQCLRKYILNYFGEKMAGSCEKCSNCLRESEEREITKECIQLIQCIRETRERYGTRVIIGIVRGESYAKLKSYGVEYFTSYGSLKDLEEDYVRQIMDHLLVEGYITLTKDKYALVKCTKKAQVLIEENYPVFMKYYKTEKEDKKDTVDVHHRRSDILTSKGLDLFDKLKELRMKIAIEEHVPPYIVFSDKSLTDMCLKLPFTKEEMLTVGGVGEHKFEKYGQKFLDLIYAFTGGKKEGFFYQEAVEQLRIAEQNGKGHGGQKDRRKKTEFRLSEEMAEELKYCAKCNLSELVNQMNALRDESTMKRIAAISIVRALSSEGLLRKQEEAIGEKYSVTELGEQFGFEVEEKFSQRGTAYQVFYVTEAAQKAIVERLLNGWKVDLE